MELLTTSQTFGDQSYTIMDAIKLVKSGEGHIFGIGVVSE